MNGKMIAYRFYRINLYQTSKMSKHWRSVWILEAIWRQLLERSCNLSVLCYRVVVKNSPGVIDVIVTNLSLNNYVPYLSRTSDVLCFRKRLRAYCLTFALIGFSACWDFWKNLGTFLKLGSDYSYFFFASSM